MHAALQILEFWALAFLSLAATVVLLNIFWNLIEQDLCLKTFGRELAIAAVASFVEAASLWLVIVFFPDATAGMISRIIFIPALIVAVIYKISHLEDWSHYEIIGLLLFQLIIVLIGASLLTAHFKMAVTILLIFGATLAAIAAFMRGL